ncbi:MAG: 3-hydroxyacyl-[acyl-carrier-protein] dehydratase [Polaribacter sp.]|jgi:3-hydroxyacyl-[acyl-carrier-protein] dehydratase
MRYQFIDKISQLEMGKRIVTIKNVTISEDFFEEHFVGFPVMPGALQIEAIAQACGALIEITSNYESFSILLMVEKMKFRKLIHPGDQMVITATILSQHDDSALFEAKIEVDNKVMTAGKIMVGVLPLNDKKMDISKTMEKLRDYYKFLLRDTEIVKSL